MTRYLTLTNNQHRLNLCIIAGLISLSPFTMEVYLPAMQVIAKELGTTTIQVNYTITFYLLGAAIGETIGGSISDQIGRKKNVIFGLLLFVLASLGIALSNNIDAIQFLRFVQALGGGFAVIVGLPTLRDLFDPQTTAQKMPLVVAATMIAPMIAPVFGSLLMQWDWRAIFVFLAAYGLFIAVLYVVFLPMSVGSGKKFSLLKLAQQYQKVIVYRVHGKPVAFYYVLLQGCMAGVFLTFLTSASWIYLEHYGVRLALLPLFFLIHTGTTFATNIIISRLIHYIDPRVIMRIGSWLYIGSVFSLFVLGLCHMLSITAFTALLCPMMVGSNMLTTSFRALLFAYFEKLTGSASSLLSLSRYSFGALGGGLTGLFFNGTLLPILCIMFIAAAGTFILVNLYIPKTTLQDIAKIKRPPDH